MWAARLTRWIAGPGHEYAYPWAHTRGRATTLQTSLRPQHLRSNCSIEFYKIWQNAYPQPADENSTTAPVKREVLRGCRRGCTLNCYQFLTSQLDSICVLPVVAILSANVTMSCMAVGRAFSVAGRARLSGTLPDNLRKTFLYSDVKLLYVDIPAHLAH